MSCSPTVTHTCVLMLFYIHLSPPGHTYKNALSWFIETWVARTCIYIYSSAPRMLHTQMISQLVQKKVRSRSSLVCGNRKLSFLLYIQRPVRWPSHRVPRWNEDDSSTGQKCAPSFSNVCCANVTCFLKLKPLPFIASRC